MASSNVQKGKILENHVADRIRDLGIDPKAYRSHGSGNGDREKSDIWTNMMIFGQNAGIECKNQKVLRISEWWKQTRALEKLRREPILVYKEYGEPLEETKVVVYLETFLQLVRAHKIAGTKLESAKDMEDLATKLRTIADQISPLG